MNNKEFATVIEVVQDHANRSKDTQIIFFPLTPSGISVVPPHHFFYSHLTYICARPMLPMNPIAFHWLLLINGLLLHFTLH